jgi:polyhydroxyalkanoate synthase
MNTWVTDLIPVNRTTYRQLIKEFYQENRLTEGTLIIRGERVDLSRIRASLLVVIAESDHISPPCQSESIMTKVGSQDQLLLKVKGGHIGMMAGRGALKRTWPQIDAWLAARSD